MDLIASMEVAGGAWIFLGVCLLMLAGVVIGFYTEKGSGITARPWDGLGAAGARGSSAGASGRDPKERMRDWSRGTR